MLSLYSIYAAMQQICCVAACIDNIADMQYVNGMSNIDLDTAVKEVVELLKPSIEMEFVNKQKHSIEKRYDTLGVVVIFSQVLGFPNTSSMMIVHPDYTVSYNRIWPAFDDSTIRITGTATIKYTGDCSPIQDVLTFLKLQQ
jgi:hypothetical protein